MENTKDVEFCDVTPDISMLQKSGQTGYSPSQSVSELTDNSIDEMIEDIILKLRIFLSNELIVYVDNAKGMDKDELILAMVLARETKGPNKLGLYGIGLKAAATSLGNYFEIISVKKGSDEAWMTWWDKEEWMKRRHLPQGQQWKFPRKKVEIPPELIGSHGTVIKIKKLNYKIGNKVNSIRADIGKRFAPYLSKKVMEVMVNDKKCKSLMPEVVDDSKKEIYIETEKGTIVGWVGLMESSSQSNQYGFNTFRNGRMITCYHKFGFKPHPTVARITGDLHLDHVPVSINKREWIETSPEYEEAWDLVAEDIKEVIAKARKKSEDKKMPADQKNKLELYKEALISAISCEDLRDYVLPEKSFPNKNSKEGKNLTDEDKKRKGATKPEDIKIIKADTEVEKRVMTYPPENPGTKEPTGTGSKRNPKRTHIIKRNIKTKITVKGKQFDYTHDVKNLGKDGPIYNSNYDKENRKLEIFSNSAFPAFVITQDKAFFAFHHIVESVANVMVEESNADWSEYEEIRRVLLREASEYVKELKGNV
jgi:hypothetical protein